MTKPKTKAKKPDGDSHDACIDAGLVARAERVVQALRRRKLTAVTAESCTAGLISAALSQADGASDQLHGSFVTYTKANKTRALGVPQKLLREKGAVNGEVAAKLATGALARSPADVAVAVTGVLGPSEDEDGNPVGLVFFACCRRGEECKVERRQYPKAQHNRLRRLVVLHALDLLEKCAAAGSGK